MAKYKIIVRNAVGELQADDTADTEADARQQAVGWTSQRGQMTWTALICAPDGKPLATYKRGRVA
jgi:hypothetical protein